MTMLKSLVGHTPCAYRIQDYLEHGTRSSRSRGAQDYLEREDRALGADFQNIPDKMQGRWARYMDATRRHYGNDRAHGTHKAIQYRHFVISPDPTDNIDLARLRELATTWAKENFGEYQVAIVYHDDNENHIPHAHLIVNNTNLETGKRLHFSNRETRELANCLQTLAMTMNLKHFDNVQGEETHPENVHERASAVREMINKRAYPRDARPSAQPEYINKTERAMLDAGQMTWKQEIRDWACVAMSLSKGDVQTYIQELARFGVRAQLRADGSFMYTHPSAETRKVSSDKLGTNYCLNGLVRANVWLSMASIAQLEGYKANIAARMTDVEVYNLPANRSIADLKAVVEGGAVTHAELIDALAVIGENKFSTLPEMTRATGEAHGGTNRRLARATEVARIAHLLPEKRTAAMQQAIENNKGEAISLEQRIARGYRLTKEQHAMLTPEQRDSWTINRRKRVRQEELSGKRKTLLGEALKERTSSSGARAARRRSSSSHSHSQSQSYTQNQNRQRGR